MSRLWELLWVAMIPQKVTYHGCSAGGETKLCPAAHIIYSNIYQAPVLPASKRHCLRRLGFRHSLHTYSETGSGKKQIPIFISSDPLSSEEKNRPPFQAFKHLLIPATSKLGADSARHLAGPGGTNVIAGTQTVQRKEKVTRSKDTTKVLWLGRSSTYRQRNQERQPKGNDT